MVRGNTNLHDLSFILGLPDLHGEFKRNEMTATRWVSEARSIKSSPHQVQYFIETLHFPCTFRD